LYELVTGKRPAWARLDDARTRLTMFHKGSSPLCFRAWP
jgi:hypothetical protein